MRVTSIRYQPIEGGGQGGYFALHVTLGAGDGPGVVFSPTALSTKLHEAFESLSLKSPVRGVLLDCREAVGTNEEMSSLIGSLKDWKYIVILWVGESTRYPWFEGCFVTAFVASQHWPNFKATEIRYVLPTTEDWIEPDVYEVNATTPCFLVAGEAKGKDILSFVTDCKRLWGVIFECRGVAAIDFPLL